MKAVIGDRLIQPGGNNDNARRVGVIVEIRHPDGTPPYLVRWPDAHESLVFPGPDARIESVPE